MAAAITPHIEDRLKFTLAHHTVPDGTPYRVDGKYSFVRDSIWDPLEGYKLWAVDPEKLCLKCSKRHNTITHDYWGYEKTQTKAHLKSGKCKGLSVEPIIVVALNWPRQEGKSCGVSGWVVQRLCKNKNESICLLAASEDQAAKIYKDNYKLSIDRSPALTKRLTCLGLNIRTKSRKRNGVFEVLAASLSVVGPTRTVVIVDEARDKRVTAELVIALVPTLYARGGVMCPGCKFRTHNGSDNPDNPKKCPDCKARLQPWHGKLIISSSFGEIVDDGTDADWWPEFMEEYTKNPDPNVFAERVTVPRNPKISKGFVDNTKSIFGRLPSFAHAVDIEMGNVSKMRGDEFVSKPDIDRSIDPSLFNNEGIYEPVCTAFLDTAETGPDICSLVIIGDHVGAGEGNPWDFVEQAHVMTWDAKDYGGVIPAAEVLRYLDQWIPFFPNLKAFAIDTRGSSWSSRMVKDIKASRRKWKGIVRAWGAEGDKESQMGWDDLEARMKSHPSRMALQPNQHQKAELLGVKRAKGSAAKRDGRGAVIDKNRRVIHKDITESTACALYLIKELQLKPRPGKLGRHSKNRRIGGRILPVMSRLNINSLT